MGGQTSNPSVDLERPALGAASRLLLHVALLLAAGWVYRHALNSDAIAYLRIAAYYASGRTDLAVSAYWGPLLSWLLVPWLKLGAPPLVAARLVLGFSAVLFTWSCGRLFRQFQLPESFCRLGAWLAVALSVYWSVENITPDLLVAALIGLAVGRMMTEKWLERPNVAVQAGLWWGLAYLAKAIALPLALVAGLGIAGLWWRRLGSDALRRIARSLMLSSLALAVIAGPWVAVLSAKYHLPTFSTSARLNHAMVGPPDRARPYPFGWQFQPPTPGRVTIWEDPSALPYPNWSPWTSAPYARHQLKVMLGNLPVVLLMLTGVHLLFPWVLLATGWRCLRGEWRRSATGQFWWWSAVPILALGALYLPGNLLISEQRYFYPAFPFLYVFSAGSCISPPSRIRQTARVRIQLFLLAVSFLLPTLLRVWVQPGSTRAAGGYAHALATKMTAATIHGPIAGSGLIGGARAGLYAAYLLGEPWVGDERQPSADGYCRSGAKVIIVNRRQRVAMQLDGDPRVENLDGRLFKSAEEATRFPLKIYQLR